MGSGEIAELSCDLVAYFVSKIQESVLELAARVEDSLRLAMEGKPNLIELGDRTQQFHSTCLIFAEMISPHSKFRYRYEFYLIVVVPSNQNFYLKMDFRELLNRVEVFARQVRSSAASSAAKSELLHNLDSHLQQIVQLIKR